MTLKLILQKLFKGWLKRLTQPFVTRAHIEDQSQQAHLFTHLFFNFLNFTYLFSFTADGTFHLFTNVFLNHHGLSCMIKQAHKINPKKTRKDNTVSEIRA